MEKVWMLCVDATGLEMVVASRSGAACAFGTLVHHRIGDPNNFISGNASGRVAVMAFLAASVKNGGDSGDDEEGFGNVGGNSNEAGGKGEIKDALLLVDGEEGVEEED